MGSQRQCSVHSWRVALCRFSTSLSESGSRDQPADLANPSQSAACSANINIDAMHASAIISWHDADNVARQTISRSVWNFAREDICHLVAAPGGCLYHAKRKRQTSGNICVHQSMLDTQTVLRMCRCVQLNFVVSHCVYPDQQRVLHR